MWVIYLILRDFHAPSVPSNSKRLIFTIYLFFYFYVFLYIAYNPYTTSVLRVCMIVVSDQN